MSHIVKIKQGGRDFNVPANLHDSLQKAHACMQASGYNCNASWQGFAAAASGKGWGEQPYSIVTNIIENRRWANGFETARAAMKKMAVPA
jgi:hypothetical protein